MDVLRRRRLRYSKSILTSGNLHSSGRAGHRSTRITCGYYRTRASQVGGRPFNAQDLKQNFFAVEGDNRRLKGVTACTTRTIRLKTFPPPQNRPHIRAALLLLVSESPL